MKEKVQEILNRVVPHAHTIVEERKNVIGSGSYLKILIAASDFEINQVKGQFPACVSLSLELDSMELQPQAFGGNGGNYIYRKTNENERHFALGSIKIPFRKPKTEEKNVLMAIEKFAENWRKAIKDNLDQMLDHPVNWESVIEN